MAYFNVRNVAYCMLTYLSVLAILYWTDVHNSAEKKNNIWQGYSVVHRLCSNLSQSGFAIDKLEQTVWENRNRVATLFSCDKVTAYNLLIKKLLDQRTTTRLVTSLLNSSTLPSVNKPLITCQQIVIHNISKRKTSSVFNLMVLSSPRTRTHCKDLKSAPVWEHIRYEVTSYAGAV